MTAREIEIRKAYVAHLRKTGRCPTFATIGTTWTEGQPIWEAMIADGTLQQVVEISPKGRRMTVTRLGPNA